MKQRVNIKFYIQLGKTFTKILALLREDKTLWVGNGSFGHSSIEWPTVTHSDRYLEFFPWINQSDILILNWPISDVSNCNPLRAIYETFSVEKFRRTNIKKMHLQKKWKSYLSFSTIWLSIKSSFHKTYY